jgi:hypothetical protein
MRFLSRFIGFWLVAAALVAAVVDGAKSIAASAFVTTPLAETWATVATYLEANAAISFDAMPWPLNFLLGWIFAAPTVSVLFVPGVALLLAGARRRRHPLGREFAT